MTVSASILRLRAMTVCARSSDCAQDGQVPGGRRQRQVGCPRSPVILRGAKRSRRTYAGSSAAPCVDPATPRRMTVSEWIQRLHTMTVNAWILGLRTG